MFFALAPALAALPELGPRTRAALGAAPARRRDAAARQSRAGASRSPAAPIPRPLGLRVPVLPAAVRGAASPVLQSSANRPAARTRAGCAEVPRADPRRRRPRARRRRAARHAVDRRRPAPLRGRRELEGAAQRRRGARAGCYRPRMTAVPLRLLRAPARRRRSRGRRGAGARARAPAADARDDRVGELRPPGGARVPGQRAHQQVRRGLPRAALLRRLRARRRDRAARDRPREGAVRRRARQRPAARRRAGQRVPSTTRCCSPATRSWASRSRTAATSATG